MHHVVPKSTYFNVSLWLAALLVATVAAAQVDLAGWNVPIALTIASAKAVLIVLFFMHVRYSTSLVQLFAASSFLWLLIMLTLMASDVLTRN